MSSFSYDAVDQSGTDALGAALGELLPDGCTVGLYGTLGAGKTRLVQAIAAAAGVPDRDVVSPTFVLLQQYQGRRPVYHFDTYRLADEDEFLELGPDEYFEGEGLTLVEWADRVENCLPRERVDVTISVISENSRRFEVTAVGDLYKEAVDQCRQRIESS